MLHLDHPSSLSPPLIPHSDLSWSPAPRDSVHKDRPKQSQPLNPSPTELLSSEQPADPPQAHKLDENHTAGLVNDASRQSTPLSELSSPSERFKSLEPTDTSESPGKTGTNPNRSTAQDSGWKREEGRKKLENEQSVIAAGVSGDQSFGKDVEGRQTMEQSTAPPQGPSATGFNPSRRSQSISSPQPSSRPPSVSYRGQSVDPIARKQSTDSISSISFPTIPSASITTSPTNSAEQKLDTKVVTILELNAELLKYVIYRERLSRVQPDFYS